MSISYSRTDLWPYHISSGGAVYRLRNTQREYALLFRDEKWSPKYKNTWHLPKGTLGSNETLEAAALREIKEESGLTTTLTAYLGSVHHVWTNSKGILIDKTTHYYLCSLASQEIEPHDDEHDRLDWFTAAEAIEKLNLVPSKQESKVIERAETWFKLQETIKDRL